MTVNGNVSIQNYVEAGASVSNTYNGTVYQGVQDDAKELPREGAENAEAASGLSSEDAFVAALGEIMAEGFHQLYLFIAVYRVAVDVGLTRKGSYIDFGRWIAKYTEGKYSAQQIQNATKSIDASLERPLEEWSFTRCSYKRDKYELLQATASHLMNVYKQRLKMV